jgi:hypothetical protein
MKEQKIFKVSDIGFSAVLQLHNISLLRIEADGRKAVFVFEFDSDINGLKMHYYNRRLKIEPLGLLDSIRTLKAAAATAITNGGEK